MERIPILLDTDPGSDIDDALALAYLLRQPRCELVGVTTVTGDVAKRAAIVEVVCRAYGREDVPIHLGASDPFAHGPGQPHVPHYDAIAHLPHRMERPTNTAVDYLRETIRSRPGEIVLLSIGPLTNIATLLLVDPEIPSLLKGFFSMAGSYFGQVPEWNCVCDPAATATAFRRSSSQTLFGLDVTLRCQMNPESVRTRFAKPPHDILLSMAETWFQSVDRVTFHDPLAAAAIFEPDLCDYRRGEVAVPLDTSDKPGTTIFTETTEGRFLAAHDVRSEAFFDHYFDILN